MSRMLKLALGSALALTFSASAFAQYNSDNELTPSEVVEYGDLDTYSDRGADTLVRRIENAAERVCYDNEIRPLRQQQIVNACTAETTANGVSDTGNSVVTARYYGYEPQVIIADNDAAYAKEKY